jgi:uncharacterized iron-regulated membrane protein
MRRPTWLFIHRYAGLAMAFFLTIAGFTGSVIAFNHELDGWLNPELFYVSNGAPPLSPLEIANQIERDDKRLRVTYVPLTVEAGHSLGLGVSSRLNPVGGKPFALGYDQLFVDPATGGVLGQRQWGACCLERQHLIPFLYLLHYTLHMPERLGMWLMGIIAIIWTFDCFIGAYLTLPRGKPFLARWRPAWRVKTGASGYRLNFDLHRASGLWLWGLLLMLAISGVALNLKEEIFRPVVSVFSPVSPSVFDPSLEQPPDSPIEPMLSRESVLSKAEQEAAKRGWTMPPYAVFFSPTFGIFGVGFGEEHPTGLGSPWIYFDGKDGRLIDARVPGTGTAGDIFAELQFPLHSGQIAGLAGRIIIAITGIAVAMLSVTGVVIWWKKSHARVRAAELKRARAMIEEVEA